MKFKILKNVNIKNNYKIYNRVLYYTRPNMFQLFELLKYLLRT